MRSDRNLVQYAIRNGCTVSVYDGEEYQIKRSRSLKAIMGAIDSVEESQLRIRDATGNIVGWALIVLGNSDEENVCDYTETPFMLEWEKTQ